MGYSMASVKMWPMETNFSGVDDYQALPRPGRMTRDGLGTAELGAEPPRGFLFFRAPSHREKFFTSRRNGTGKNINPPANAPAKVWALRISVDVAGINSRIARAAWGQRSGPGLPMAAEVVPADHTTCW